VAQVLVVDDERSMREFLQILLEGEGHEVATAGGVSEGIEAAGRHNPELVLTDLRLPDGTGMEVLRWCATHRPDTQVIMMTAFGSTENAVEAMRLGAYDYQTKPVKVDEIRVLTAKALEKLTLLRDNRMLSEQLRGRVGLSGLMGKSKAVAAINSLIEKVATSRTNVLIEGESGVGKELVARAVHQASPRRSQPFVAINCGAIPETLIEAELFGHAQAAFTGATKARAGLFESAHQGTLLLDEIGELPQTMQVKLLRALQERKVRRIGEDRERSVDVRIIAATNRDLQSLVQAGEFREDLFFRLNVVRIRVPPLRERAEDIAMLAGTFVTKFAQEQNKAVRGVAPDAVAALEVYRFPGNVRELENYMERAVALAAGELVQVADLPDVVTEVSDVPGGAKVSLPAGGLNLEETLAEIERNLIDAAMQRSGGVKTKAASLLGLTFRSFRYRLEKGKDEG
jgi:two-component system response regulator PilR (NtrC family)